MNFLKAASKVLEEIGKPLNYKELTRLAQAKGYLLTSGKTPWATMNASLNTDIKKKGELSLFRSLGNGVFSLRKPTDIVLDDSDSNHKQGEKQYFIFVVNDVRQKGHFMKARKVYDSLMESGLWGINERTQHRRELLKGSKILFYQAGKNGQTFIGMAKISKDIFKLTPEEIAKRKLQSVLFDGEYAIHLQDIEKWESRKPIQELVSRLDFIKKNERYGVYLQGGVRKISKSDFRKIVDYNPTGDVLIDPSINILPKHAEVEGMLIDLGNLLGFDTFCADKSKIFNDARLSEWTSLKKIPNFSMAKIVRVARLIDVIWFKDDFPVYAFEVEVSTDITKGLLRLHQLIQFQTGLFIISSQKMQNKFNIEISKSPFCQSQERYTFRTFTELKEFYKIAKRYHKKKSSFIV